jgi:hypothetical protein
VTAVVVLPIVWVQTRHDTGAVTAAALYQAHSMASAPGPFAASPVTDASPEHQGIEPTRSDAADRPNSDAAEAALPKRRPLAISAMTQEALGPSRPSAAPPARSDRQPRTTRMKQSSREVSKAGARGGKAAAAKRVVAAPEQPASDADADRNPLASIASMFGMR